MAVWTQQQQDAINVRGRSVIVSAAAGSGKTSVLIERLINLIFDTENKINVENMVVVTFTNAAAAEMKQRLSAALLRKIEENPHDRWLSRQYSFLGNASISTVHSFCFNLIRDNISSVELSADFRIIEESEQKVFSDTVLKAYIEELYETHPDDMKLLCDSFCGNNDSALVEMIPDLYKNLSSIPFYKQKLKKFEHYYSDDTYKKSYMSGYLKKLTAYKAVIEDIIRLAETIEDAKITEMLDDDLNIINTVCELFENQEYSRMFDFLSEVSFIKFPRAKKDFAYPEEREYIKNTRTAVREALQALPKSSSIILSADEDLERHKRIFAILIGIISEYEKRLFDYKVQKNAIAFDDSEQITLSLLAQCDENGNISRTPLGDEISRNYELIMVDEFQDTNDRQDMIFRLLSRNGSADTYGSNLFFVGDVKQAIYRFRQANPDNFIKVIKKFSPYKKDENVNSVIKLSRNFRSSPEVIDFVNYVFKNIMSEQAGDIDYNSDEYLVNGAEFFDSQRDTHIMLIDKTENRDDTEAVCIAAKIREMIDSRVPVTDFSCEGNKRPCQPKDFCILLRKKNMNSIYTQALEQYGLLVNCEDVSGYLKSREVSILLNILRVVDNPLLDIPVASVMMSPMYMFTADDMAQIRLINKKGKIYNNLSALLGKGNNQPLCDAESPLYKKADDFFGFISHLRMISAFYTLPELIQIIYDRTDFTSVISLYKDAERKRANLRILLDYANSYESVSGGGIGGFLRYVDRISESKGDFKSVGTVSAQNSVSVKTMHKSKGLEFPFVFVAQTDTQFSTIDDKKKYQFSTELGLGFRLQNKEQYQKFRTIPFEVINSHNKNKMLGEEMRLLYVALTRAKERLFITLDISERAAKTAAAVSADIYKNQGITPQLAGSVSSMAEWLMMCIISHPKSAQLREEFGLFESFRYDDDFPLSFEKVTPDYDCKYQEISDYSDSFAESDTHALEKLKKSFDYKYDSRYVNVISKLSVSDISKNDDSQPLLLRKPSFAFEEGELSAAEKGTALHAFLQFTDFNALEDDFEKEKKRMLNSGYITPKQADAVKRKDIEAFMNSELYCKIKNADKIIRERKFLISIDDLQFDDDFSKVYKGTDGMLNGIMDMIIENDDGVILVDYKTDKVDNVRILADRYRMQLLMYKKALQKTQCKPVKSVLIYSFYKHTQVEIFDNTENI